MITSILDIILILNNNDLQNRKAIHDDKIDFVKNRWPFPATAVDTPVNTPVDIHVDIHVDSPIDSHGCQYGCRHGCRQPCRQGR